MENQSTRKSVFPIISKEEALAIRGSSPQEAALDIASMLRKKSENRLACIVSLALLSYLKRKNSISEEAELRALLERQEMDASVKMMLSETSYKHYKEISSFAERWNESQIMSVILNNFSWYARYAGKVSGQVGTPQPFSKLALELLEVQPGESVLNYCSGIADFSMEAYLSKDAAFYGTEISYDAVIVSKIRSMVLGCPAHIEQGDSLMADVMADKVFADPPFSVRDDNWEKIAFQDENLIGLLDCIPKTKRMDWAFVLSALSKQRSGGKTVVLTYEGLLFRTSKGECEMRRYLLDSGKLEAVIALPQGVLPCTQIACNLLVFSEDNTTVKMVDIRDCKEKERYLTKMSAENLDVALQRINGESEYSRAVPREEIAKRDFNLSPAGYVAANQITVENGIALGDLVMSLERGQVTPAAKLEELATKEETDFQYLMLKDIENDTVQMPLPYLQSMEDSWGRFCVSEGNLVISRSAPIKIAIVPDLKGKKVLANGNMYFMSLDKKRIHPIYVLCYLKSQEGRRQIEYLSKGSSIMILAPKDLLQLKIPMLPMERQLAIVDEYLHLREQLRELHIQKQSLENKLEKILEKAD